jgi:molybdopterin molybdotransferase
MSDLLSVAEAQQIILSDFHPTQPVKVALDLAYGRILAEDIYSWLEFPSFANSSMDGYALRAEDVATASKDNPVTLAVVGDAPAGRLITTAVRAGQAVRIMTGAPLPAGCDAVVPVEDTGSSFHQTNPDLPSKVEILKPAKPGDNIRPVGQDIQTGDLIVTSGTRIGAQHMGMLAMIGCSVVPVYRQPRVALFSSGDELVAVGNPLMPGKIYDANTPMLISLAEKYSAEVIHLGVAPDRAEEIRKILDLAVREEADLILSSAGVSVGSFDYIRSVLQADGEISFWRVNMRPGKPLTYGRYKGIPFIGLPGNPVSAFMGFEIFVRPVLMKLHGYRAWQRPMIQVEIEEAIESDGRESYLRAIVHNEQGKWLGKLTGHQGSGNLRSLVQANALLLIPSEVKSLPVGAQINGWLLEE